MENEEQPAAELSKEERIERHFTTANDHWNGFTFKIYASATESGLFEDVEIPLDAFSYAEGFLFANRNKPVSVVNALMGNFDEQIDPPFTAEHKRFMLTHLIRYYDETYFTDKDGKHYQLDKIKKLLESQKNAIVKAINGPTYGMATITLPNKDSFDWQVTKQYIATMPDTTAKIKHLIERRAEYKQRFDGFNIKGWGPEYDEQCQTEIKKLKDLAELEQQGHPDRSPFKLSGKTGAKTNLIRVLNALYELNLIELENGQRPTKEQFMQQIGGFMGVDMKRYEQTLSTALEQPLETNLKVFDELKKAIQAQVLARQENGRK